MSKPRKRKPTLKSRPKPTLKSRSQGVPRGFKPVPKYVSASDLTRQVIAAEQQRHSLFGVARALDREEKVVTSVHVHANKDGTVDGELRISNIKRGYKINDLLTDISILMHGASPKEPSEWRLAHDHWVSTGALTDWGGSKTDWNVAYKRHIRRGKSDEEARALATAEVGSPLPRYRGQSRVAVYPQRAVDLPTNIFRAQQGFLGEQFRDRRTGRVGGRGDKTKPAEILIRVYWNPENRRPGRK